MLYSISLGNQRNDMYLEIIEEKNNFIIDTGNCEDLSNSKIFISVVKYNNSSFIHSFKLLLFNCCFYNNHIRNEFKQRHVKY